MRIAFFLLSVIGVVSTVNGQINSRTIEDRVVQIIRTLKGKDARQAIELAQEAAAKKKLEGATVLCREVITLGAGATDSKVRREALQLMYDLKMAQGNFEEAFKVASTIEEETDQENSELLLEVRLQREFVAMLRLSDEDTALRIIGLKTELSKYRDELNYSEACRSLKDILRLETELVGSENLTVAAHEKILADNLIGLGETASAQSSIDRTIRIAREAGNKAKVMLAHAMITKGDCFTAEGAISKAIASYTEAKSLFAELDQKQDTAYAMAKLGASYLGQYVKQKKEALIPSLVSQKDSEEGNKWFDAAAKELSPLFTIESSLDSLGHLARQEAAYLFAAGKLEVEHISQMDKAMKQGAAATDFERIVSHERFLAKSKFFEIPRATMKSIEFLRCMAFASYRESRGDLNDAAIWLEEAYELSADLHGSLSTSNVETKMQLADVQFRLKEFAECEETLNQIESMLPSMTNQEPREAVAFMRMMIANESGDFKRAIAILKSVIQVGEEAKKPRLALALAEAYRKAGELVAAQAIAEGVHRAVCDDPVAKEPYFCSSIITLARVKLDLGEPSKAENLLSEAVRNRRSAGKDKSLDYADLLNDLAALHLSEGDIIIAESYFAEVLGIDAKLRGTNDYGYAKTLSNLAGCAESKGDIDRAIQYSLESIEIKLRSVSRLSPDLAFTANNIAHLVSKRVKPSIAEELLSVSHNSLVRAYGPEHPIAIRSSTSLANLLLQSGKFEEANILLEASRTISTLTLRADPFSASFFLLTFAKAKLGLADRKEALSLANEAVSTVLSQLEIRGYSLSERRQIAAVKAYRGMLDAYINICVSTGELTDKSAELVLSWKNSVLARQALARLHRNSPTAQEELQELEKISSELSAMVSRLQTEGDSGVWRLQIETLIERRDRAESRAISAMKNSFQSVTDRSIQSICDSIPDEAVLVDFLQYSTPNGNAVLATVLKPDGNVLQLPLGNLTGTNFNQVDLGELVDIWRSSFGTSDKSLEAGKQLRELLWEPLLDAIGNKKRIFICPDGLTARISFNALPGKISNTYLIEDFRISSIPAPGWLCRQNTIEKSDDKLFALLVGNVDYGPARKELSWKSLDSTGPEIISIGNMFRSKHGEDNGILVLEAKNASEKEFKDKVVGYKTVHLATHGFFTSVGQEDDDWRSQGASSSLDSFNTFIGGYAPGQLSGLVFAGANSSSLSNTVVAKLDNNDDGLINADEMSLLNLSRAELIVLSACETGLGKNAGAEGLLGLQRAMHVAGASTTVTTLWKIDDPSTQKIMEQFYRIYLVEGKSPLDALHEAQIWAIKNPDLFPTKYRTRGLPEPKTSESAPRLSPEVWAPFVASGGSFSK